MLDNLHDMITPAAPLLCVDVCLCLCMSVRERQRDRGETICREQGCSGNVVLNICELDDTHLK